MSSSAKKSVRSLCHDPHTLQKIETYKKGLIAYSLGNLMFDYHAFLKNHTKENAEKSRQNIILKCTMSKQGLIGYSIIPIQLNSEFQPTVVPRNSKLSQKIIAKVNAHQPVHRSSLDKKELKHTLKEITAIFNGLAVNLRRKKTSKACTSSSKKHWIESIQAIFSKDINHGNRHITEEMIC
jgi:hypothetical protein